jgi:hypothetical protein
MLTATKCFESVHNNRHFARIAITPADNELVNTKINAFPIQVTMHNAGAFALTLYCSHPSASGISSCFSSCLFV